MLDVSRKRVEAERAVNRTETEISTRIAIHFESRLHDISKSLNDAIEEKNERWIRALLEQWRKEASNIHGILTGQEPPPTDLLVVLAKSATLSTEFIDKRTRAGDTPFTYPRKTLQSIADCCIEYSKWVGQTSLRSGEGNE